jgi:hypothetical protein
MLGPHCGRVAVDEPQIPIPAATTVGMWLGRSMVFNVIPAGTWVPAGTEIDTRRYIQVCDWLLEAADPWARWTGSTLNAPMTPSPLSQPLAALKVIMRIDSGCCQRDNYPFGMGKIADVSICPR